ncbi:MAG: hypothetical protein ACTHN8_01040 [Angustibacter sp.]
MDNEALAGESAGGSVSGNGSILNDRRAWRGLGWLVLTCAGLSCLIFLWPLGIVLLGLSLWRLGGAARRTLRRARAEQERQEALRLRDARLGRAPRR